MSDRPEVGGIRIAELVATLSYAADLGLGQPMEHCMRQTVIAVRLATSWVPAIATGRRPITSGC
jgi:hypothetical protein